MNKVFIVLFLVVATVILFNLIAEKGKIVDVEKVEAVDMPYTVSCSGSECLKGA